MAGDFPLPRPRHCRLHHGPNLRPTLRPPPTPLHLLQAAAKLASTPEEQHRANEEIRSEMEGGRRGSGGGAPEMDEALDTGTGLEENLHKRGP